MSDSPARSPSATAAATPGEFGAMSFREHLVELRGRLVRASIAVGIAFFVAWSFHVELYTWLSAPVRAALAANNLFAIKALQITESIEVYMRISLVGGIFLASPFVFYQIWGFVAPGLLAAEKRLVVPVISGSVASFVMGAAFCYVVVLPFMTDFLIKMTMESPGLTLEPTLASTVSFSVVLLLAFGAVFELPLFMYILSAVGLVSAKGFLGFYRYWIVVSFIIGAVLTPTPDPINQAMMSLPLVLLYGVGIGIAWLVERNPEQKLSRVKLGLVAVVLVALAVGGVSLAARRGDGQAVDDLPADAAQIVGLHVQRLSSYQQAAERDSAAAKLLGPLLQLRKLGLEKPRDPMVMLVRMKAGVAAVLTVDGADGHLQRLSKQYQASIVQTPSGPATWLPSPNGRGRWRVVAAGKALLWVGDDVAVEALAEARQKRRPRLVDNPALVEQFDAIRGAGPVWALATGGPESGLGRWLPAGAMQANTQAATAFLGADKPDLEVRFACRGPDAATALRDRLDAWVADSRRRATPIAADDSQYRAAQQLSELAVLVARSAEASARLLPIGTNDYQTLMASSHQAMRISRELAPAEKPVAPADTTDQALIQAVASPGQAEAEVRGSTVVWKVKAELPRLLAMLAAPSDAGIDAEVLRAPIVE